MKIKEKQLLLKDLCCRLPYKVKLETLEGPQELDVKWLSINMCNIAHPYLPYLYPLSIIEELGLLEEYENIVCALNNDKNTDFVFLNHIEQLLEFYHKNHIDYRDLIPKCLAIDCTGLNIY